MRVLPAQPPRAPSKFWQPQSHPPSMDTIPTLHKQLNEVGLINLCIEWLRVWDIYF